MNKSTTIACAFALSLTLFSCQSKTQKTDIPTMPPAPIGEQLPIAYINVDTILSNYTLAIEANEKLIKKQEDARLNINTQAKQLQNEMVEFQRKLENNAFLSRERAEQEAKRLQKKESDLQELDKKLTSDLVAEQQKISETLRTNIDAAIRKYNADGRFHFILSTGAMQETVLFALDGYNISNDILEILNNNEK